MKNGTADWPGHSDYVSLLISSGAIGFQDGVGPDFNEPVHPKELCFSAVPLTAPKSLEQLVTSLRSAASTFHLLGNAFVPMRATNYMSIIAGAANDDFVEEARGIVYLDAHTAKGARNLVTKSNLGSRSLKSCRGVISLLATERAKRREKTLNQLHERFSDLAGHSVPIYALATLDDISHAVTRGSTQTGLAASWYLHAESQSGYERF